MRGNLACPVLRGRGRGNALPLPDRLLHELAKTDATFDDPNLVSRAGLVPVMALAERAGLAPWPREHVRSAGRAGRTRR